MTNQNSSTTYSCLFCFMPADRVVASNALAYAVHDGFPVTEGHTLVIPKRHVENFFGLSDEEVLACNQLHEELRSTIMAQDQLVEGFNVGMNAGEVAGQTIFHFHIHLIPRRKGDVENLRGGVRHTIPGKGFYRVEAL
jgi:ATP adenylyltransferase